MRSALVWVALAATVLLVAIFALDWHTFELAQLTVSAWQIPTFGAALAATCCLLVAVAATGLWTGRRRQAAAVALPATLGLAAWLCIAYLTRGSVLAVMPQEVVTPGPGYEVAAWATFVAFFGALAALVERAEWQPGRRYLRVAILSGDTVMHDEVLRPLSSLTVGLAGIPCGRIDSGTQLFRVDRHGIAHLGLPAGLEGVIRTDTASERVAVYREQDFERPLDEDEWGQLSLGFGVSAAFHFLEPEGPPPVATTRRLDSQLVAALAVSLLVQCGLVYWSLHLWQETAVRRVVDNPRRGPHVTAVIFEEPEEVVVDPFEEPGDEEAAGSEDGADGEEGTFGSPEVSPSKRSVVPDSRGQHIADEPSVTLVDLLATNQLGGSGAIATILDHSSEGFGNKIALAMEGEGSEFVMGHGSRGVGFRGFGDGGPGDSPFGRFRSAGKLPGARGVRTGLTTKKSRRVGSPFRKAPSLTEHCEKGSIRSAVKRRGHAIRACYERQLQAGRTGLRGKITVRWTIGPVGKVSAARAIADTLADGSVSACVLRVLRRIRFQAPKQGICVVQWPFVFSTSDPH